MDCTHQSKDTEWLDGLKNKYMLPLDLGSKDKHRLEAKAWKMIHEAKSSQKKAGISILISGKIDLKPKKVARCKK